MRTGHTWRALGVLVACLAVLVGLSAYALAGVYVPGRDGGWIQAANGFLGDLLEGAGDQMRGANGKTVLVKSQQQSMVGIGELRVSFSSDDLVIIPTNEAVLTVDWYGDAAFLPEETFSMEQNGDQLLISQIRRPGLFGIMTGDQRVEVRVPVGFTDTAVYHTSSGDIRMEGDAGYDLLKLESSSGDVQAKGSLQAQRMTVSTSSGEVELSARVQAEEFEAKSSSGDMELDRLYVQHFDLQTTSGELNARIYGGSGQVSTSSGDVGIDLLEQVQAISVSTSSGSVQLAVNRALGYDFEASTSSGDIEGASGVRIHYRDDDQRQAYAAAGGSPRVIIDVTTRSGDIELRHSGND